MAGHCRPKDGVASARLCPAIHVLPCLKKKDVDARDKPGLDELLVRAMTPYLRPGIVAAIAVLVLDQATKLWLLFVFDIARRGAVRVTPFFDLVLAWNTGISYGWFQTESLAGQATLLAIKAIAVVVLAIWMARSQTRIAAIALGLIIGGAIGNAIDSLAYGAVVDFALFHVQIGEKDFSWYVFNLADTAIVAGVAALLYDSFFGVPAVKAP
jgi:signal peptidase II